MDDCIAADSFCFTNIFNYFLNAGVSPFDINLPEEKTFEYPPLQDHTDYLGKPEIIAAIGGQKNYVNCSLDIENRYIQSGDR